MKGFREIGIIILIALAIFTLLRVTVQGYTVQYSCMLPNIEEGEWIMASKASYFFSNPERGEVIIFNPPNHSRFPYIKRVIGLPGETVEVKDGLLHYPHYLRLTPCDRLSHKTRLQTFLINVVFSLIKK